MEEITLTRIVSEAELGAHARIPHVRVPEQLNASTRSGLGYLRGKSCFEKTFSLIKLFNSVLYFVQFIFAHKSYLRTAMLSLVCESLTLRQPVHKWIGVKGRVVVGPLIRSDLYHT